MDFCLQKLLHGLVKIDTWISVSCYINMYLSKLFYGFDKLLHGFVKFVLSILHRVV